MRADLHEFGYPQGFVELAFTPGGQWRDEGDRLATAALSLLESAQRSPAEESLAQVIEDVFGVDVGIYELGEDFDGLAATNETCRIMIVNTSLSPGRQRFTMAHELAHALVGDDQEVHLDANVHDPAGRQVPSEARANAFASSFLMPEQWLREQIGHEGLSVEAMAVMAWRLRVTPAALSIRLQGLRLIDAGQKSDLGRISEFRAASLAGQGDGFGHRVAHASQTRPPGLLVRDSFTAYSDGVTTLRPYARLIGADLEELRRSLEFNGVTEAP